MAQLIASKFKDSNLSKRGVRITHLNTSNIQSILKLLIMRKISIVLILALSVANLTAQSYTVKLKFATGPNRLQVFATPSGLGGSDVLSALTVTLKWPTSAGTSLGTVTSAFPAFLPFSKEALNVSGSNNLQIISGFNPVSGLTLTNGTETLLASIEFLGVSAPSCPVEIENPYTSPASIVGNFFAEINSMTDVSPSSSFSSEVTGSVLPTELLSFKGIKKGKVSQLQWEATNEKNLVNYIIERSSDGKNFHPVGFTKPRAAAATDKVAYDFIDDQPEIGINYYRLLSKGLGKDEKYSKVISLDFGLGLSGRAYPNPLDGDLTIDLDIESNSGVVEVGIFDVVGKQVYSKKIENSDRRINATLPTSDLPPGSYFIKVKIGSYNWERQITKM
jgi:Secretion system C-terminal sorting domain